MASNPLAPLLASRPSETKGKEHTAPNRESDTSELFQKLFETLRSQSTEELPDLPTVSEEELSPESLRPGKKEKGGESDDPIRLLQRLYQTVEEDPQAPLSPSDIRDSKKEDTAKEEDRFSAKKESVSMRTFIPLPAEEAPTPSEKPSPLAAESYRASLSLEHQSDTEKTRFAFLSTSDLKTLIAKANEKGLDVTRLVYTEEKGEGEKTSRTKGQARSESPSLNSRFFETLFSKPGTGEQRSVPLRQQPEAKPADTGLEALLQRTLQPKSTRKEEKVPTSTSTASKEETLLAALSGREKTPPKSTANPVTAKKATPVSLSVAPHEPSPLWEAEETLSPPEEKASDPSLPKTGRNGMESAASNLAGASSATEKSDALTQKIIDAKQTVRHFAHSLQREVENYKPPFSRMQLNLDPKELGSVEVTLISRGNQLHIQVHSNPTAIGVMATQGQELKTQLVSMGFTDVQMQFNMNQQQQRGRHPSQGTKLYTEGDEIPEHYESLDIIVAQYV